jgi:hypothetical protein
VTLAHKAGKIDRRSEICLAIAKHNLNELPDPIYVAEQFADNIEQSCHHALADLWMAIGDQEQAKQHAVAAYKWAWADGEPYVRRFQLTKARELLEKLGAEIPNLPPYDQTTDEKTPLEDKVANAIKYFRAKKETMEQASK